MVLVSLTGRPIKTWRTYESKEARGLTTGASGASYYSRRARRDEFWSLSPGARSFHPPDACRVQALVSQPSSLVKVLPHREEAPPPPT